MPEPDLRGVVEHLPTKSGKIRALAAHGVSRAEIARTLGISYQHVRSVLEQDKARKAKAASAPPGMSEPPAIFDDGMPSVKVRLGPEGRVVIKLVPPRAAMMRAQALVRSFVPVGVSLAEELIADRRREAEREAKE